MKKNTLVWWWYLSHAVADADGYKFAELDTKGYVTYEHRAETGHRFSLDYGDTVDYTGNRVPAIRVQHPVLRTAVDIAERAGILDCADTGFPVYWDPRLTGGELLAQCFDEFDITARRAMWIIEDDPEDFSVTRNAVVVFESPSVTDLGNLMINSR